VSVKIWTAVFLKELLIYRKGTCSKSSER